MSQESCLRWLTQSHESVLLGNKFSPDSKSTYGHLMIESTEYEGDGQCPGSCSAPNDKETSEEGGRGEGKGVEFCMTCSLYGLFFLFVIFWGWEWNTNNECVNVSTLLENS